MSKDAQESSKSIYEMAKASLEEALEKHRIEEEAKDYYGSADEWLRQEAIQTVRDEQQRLLEEYFRKVEDMSEQERKAYLLGDWNNLVNQPVLPVPEYIQSEDEFYEWIKSQE